MLNPSEELKTVPKIPEPQNNGSDCNADKESEIFASGRDYEAEAKANDHDRSELIKDNLHWASIVIIWFIVIGLGVFGIIFVVHLVTPWGWLEDDKVHDIQNILFSGVLASVLSSHFKKYL